MFEKRTVDPVRDKKSETSVISNGVEIKNLENSTVEIKSSISVEELNKYKEKAIKELGAEVSIDGFRKGHIPEDVLVRKIGEMTILNQMAEMALSDIYPIIVLENKIDVIGQPQITITKMTPHNPVEFKITSAVLPQFELPNYKEIAKKINLEKIEKIEVNDKEVEDTLIQIQKAHTVQNAPPKSTEKSNPPKADEQSSKLPEINDEFVKKLGAFKDVADFKIKLKETIKKDKENKAIEVKRVRMMDSILAETKINLPQIIIESEAERMLAQTKADITRMGLQFDKYIEHLKKTEEDLKKELQPEAEKRAKIQFVLDKIIKIENIKPDEEEVKKNVEQILKQHKESKPEIVQPYIEMVLSNQEVFKLLEKQ